MPKQDAGAKTVHEQVVRALEDHGHPFQQRCLAEIVNNASGFTIESKEYQVSVAGQDTVIDFILSHAAPTPFYLVFECKRANLQYVRWVFANARELLNREDFFLTTKIGYQLPRGSKRIHFKTAKLRLIKTPPVIISDIGIEVANQAPKNKKSGITENIYSACQQVLTGISGLAREHASHVTRSGAEEVLLPQYFVPIVVTSAELFVVDYSSSDVSLESGTLDLEKSTTQSVPYLISDVPVREGIQITTPEQFHTHDDPPPTENHRLMYKTKSVAIVQAKSLILFLNQLNLFGEHSDYEKNRNT